MRGQRDSCMVRPRFRVAPVDYRDGQDEDEHDHRDRTRVAHVEPLERVLVSVITIIPMLVVFVFGQRFFVEEIQIGAVKG